MAILLYIGGEGYHMVVYTTCSSRFIHGHSTRRRDYKTQARVVAKEEQEQQNIKLIIIAVFI